MIRHEIRENYLVARNLGSHHQIQLRTSHLIYHWGLTRHSPLQRAKRKPLLCLEVVLTPLGWHATALSIGSRASLTSRVNCAFSSIYALSRTHLRGFKTAFNTLSTGESSALCRVDALGTDPLCSLDERIQLAYSYFE